MTKLHKAVVTGHSFSSLAIEREVLTNVAELVETQPRSRDEVIAAARDAHAVLNQNSLIDTEVVRSLSKCRVIVAYGIGTDKIDLVEATKQGIQVCNAPDYCLEEVATHTIALLLSIERQIPMMMARLRAGHWDHPHCGSMRRLSGLTFGCLGMGRIAQLVAKSALALGMRVIATDPFVATTTVAGVDFVSLDELLLRSDYLSIHCPLTPETHGLVDAGFIAKMRPDAVLINASRGKIVRESDLISALSRGRLRAAGLDVFESEPLDPDNPLLRMDNVVVTPHVAWHSEAAEEELKRTVAEEARLVLCGLAPRFPVNELNAGSGGAAL